MIFALILTNNITRYTGEIKKMQRFFLIHFLMIAKKMNRV